jgi:hypothetical protein
MRRHDVKRPEFWPPSDHADAGVVGSDGKDWNDWNGSGATFRGFSDIIDTAFSAA